MMHTFRVVLAIIGFLFLTLTLGGRMLRQSTKPNTDRLLPLAIGIILMAPFCIYIFTSKPIAREKLLPNRDNYQGKEGYTIYVLNETKQTLIVNRSADLEPNQFHIFHVQVHDTLYFSNGVSCFINREGDLEIKEPVNRTIVIRDSNFSKYNIPEYVHFAMVLT